MFHHSKIRDEAVERALTNQAARLIVSHCIRAPRSAKALSEVTRLPLASTYRHIHNLVGDDILVVERSALTEDGKPFDLYRSRVRFARIELMAERVVVGWEANEAIEDRIKSMWDFIGR
ncbi:MAG: hypothetical protein KY455_10690 [Euryarchaeota archaeon]|nr:hypothetical protein [Euryarchaeota archaeon]